ncbi:Palmitoyltransferase pfa5 [Fusarium piperis]|uniref:Palmitoyltransferase n=1 Tax=Fusarium piperis TaxID=1435070 RepID=A0A9W8W539_9HYPO|nr:Palmitoyltransferase pfa5 [Fusarium piperis]
MPRPATSNRAETRWTVRLVPFFCAAAIGYATYLTVAHLCVNYLLREKKKTATAVVLLVLYFVFFFLTIATYLRTFLTIQFKTGIVPLTPEREALDQQRQQIKKRGGDLEALPWVPPDRNPDSPGLETFYSKDVFVCESDGRPRWCSECRNWKPDRAHHSSDLDRCVRKMDHLCPWVGGVVGENSFNFFVQFTLYCAAFCAVCLAASGYSLHLKMQDGESLDARIVVGIALAGLFCLFTSAMTMTSARFVLTNITNIDLFKKNQVFRLAVRVPQATRPTDGFQTIVYPLSSVPPSPYVIERGQLNSVNRSRTATPEPRMSARDQQARRTFAILMTEPGENPWDLGYWGNFKSVMGNSIFEWLLPIRHSPCCNHDSMVSDYEYGPLVEVLKRRYGITDDEPAKEGIEMTSN